MQKNEIMNISEIKNLLDRGDYVKIARIAGYTDLTKGRKYVYNVMCGRIAGKRGIGKKILEAAIFIAQRNTENGKPIHNKTEDEKTED